MATLLQGSAFAKALLSRTTTKALVLEKNYNISPHLVNLRVGDHPDSLAYSKKIEKRCQESQLKITQRLLPDETTTSDLKKEILLLNQDAEVHGVLLQHPFPSGIQEQVIFEALDPQKDVDGVSPTNFGKMALGMDSFVGCTPLGILQLLDFYQIPLSGKHAVILGRSAILGKPLAFLLLARNATVTLCHSKTTHLPALVSQADILVSAIGKAEFVQGAWIKEGAVVIDAGYSEGKGDIVFETASLRASAITPVPGGVGPVTLAVLIQQVVQACVQQKQILLPSTL
jgi:methylenetetrahydrofolate dehydrogenase (NADP+)/methenyltetrahydrofolate cyclohydrolase